MFRCKPDSLTFREVSTLYFETMVRFEERWPQRVEDFSKVDQTSFWRKKSSLRSEIKLFGLSEKKSSFAPFHSKSSLKKKTTTNIVFFLFSFFFQFFSKKKILSSKFRRKSHNFFECVEWPGHWFFELRRFL